MLQTFLWEPVEFWWSWIFLASKCSCFELSPSRRVVFICFNESPLKMMKNTLYFILKAIFFLEIFKFLSRIFAYVEKRLDKKAYLIFKIYDATNWATNNYNTHIIPISQPDNGIWSVNTISHEIYFSWKIIHSICWRS